MILSTLAFIYTPSFDEVLLITKQKPESHKGMLNGLGGKCEENESFIDCIVREVHEEANLVVPAAQWHRIGGMSWSNWQVEVFATVFEGHKQAANSTKEEIAWYTVKDLPAHAIPNLHWLIPLGIDCLKNPHKPTVEINYVQ